MAVLLTISLNILPWILGKQHLRQAWFTLELMEAKNWLSRLLVVSLRFSSCISNFTDKLLTVLLTTPFDILPWILGKQHLRWSRWQQGIDWVDCYSFLWDFLHVFSNFTNLICPGQSSDSFVNNTLWYFNLNSRQATFTLEPMAARNWLSRLLFVSLGSSSCFFKLHWFGEVSSPLSVCRFMFWKIQFRLVNQLHFFSSICSAYQGVSYKRWNLIVLRYINTSNVRQVEIGLDRSEICFFNHVTNVLKTTGTKSFWTYKRTRQKCTSPISYCWQNSMYWILVLISLKFVGTY